MPKSIYGYTLCVREEDRTYELIQIVLYEF